MNKGKVFESAADAGFATPAERDEKRMELLSEEFGDYWSGEQGMRKTLRRLRDLFCSGQAFAVEKHFYDKAVTR
jgi:hypothetical protein